MRTTTLAILVTIFISAWLLPSCAAAGPTPTATVAEPARIKVLYDAFGKDAAMTKEWGYAALVEINGKRILFDTGNDPAVFAKNVTAKGVDLAKLDFVVLSHRHTDHVSEVSYLLGANPNVKIYAPADGLGGTFGYDIPSKFYRTDEALPAEMRYYGGTPPEIIKFGTVFSGAHIQLIDKTTELVPSITLIALVSDAPGTKELKELSLAINTADGLVLVVGCSHPGIENIVAEAAKINPHIHVIAGGFHLVRPRTRLSKRLPQHCMPLTKWTTSLPVTVPASLLLMHFKRCLAIITFMPAWGRHSIWARTRARHRIDAQAVAWTKPTCLPTVPS